jgi:hypothetical protein
MILICINIVYGAAVQQTITNQQVGLTIEIPTFDIVQINTNYTFLWHVFNENGSVVWNNTVSCTFHLYDSITEKHIFEKNNIKTMDSDLIDFKVEINDSLFTQEGNYYKIIQCNNTYEGGFRSENFRVGNNNTVLSTIQESIIYSVILSFIFILTLVCLISIFFINPKDNYILLRDNKYQLEFNYGYYLRMFLISLGYGLLWSLLFILWEISKKFLLSGLMSGIIYYSFIVLTYGVIPLLIIIFSLSIIKIFSDLDLNRRMQGGFKPFP